MVESRFKGELWVVVGVLIAAAWTFSACGGTDAVGPTDDAGSSGASSSGASSSGSSGSSGAGGEDDSGTSSSGDGGSSGNANSTEPNLKIAFIGDTSAKADFKSVLQLIKTEGADGVLIQGDLTYGDTPTAWFNAIDGEINTATTKIPYFVSKGNHDITWGLGGNFGIAPRLNERMTTFGVTPDHNDPTKVNYAFTFKGLKVVMVSDSETNPTRATYVQDRLANDPHVWKICSFHKNQRASNVGDKDDEMGWGIYENCRAAGAIVAQGHSHTYSRSKTLTNDANQGVDPACSDPFELCVGPGKHFFFDSSLGGVGTRSLDTTVSAKTYWGSTFTGDFGALFIEFNVDGDPKKARGYFKTIGGVITDPPASSGKTSFTITAQ